MDYMNNLVAHECRPASCRDFGASVVKASKREEITTLSMAEDAIAFIGHLGFRGIDACSGSMRGVILQQILILTSTTPHVRFLFGYTMLFSQLQRQKFLAVTRSSLNILPNHPRLMDDLRMRGK
ncbi:uncharacterized protein EI90DRAFT_3081068 [Cantharellus anzutake]|uniref:uncharacterized protein n=1 Tax=Cantharellus anzutake TaxID=1750568 RepID=UPI0019030EEC|nr:uncharacterized protein EI90DRAFT_3081068 [Cantharellus anzutake]KAF8320219.1 hypothetical protein EI90DRAFT_3081068 [Cantharellus anzutake]